MRRVKNANDVGTMMSAWVAMKSTEPSVKDALKPSNDEQIGISDAKCGMRKADEAKRKAQIDLFTLCSMHLLYAYLG